MSKKGLNLLCILCLLVFNLVLSGCFDSNGPIQVPNRDEAIPAQAQKQTFEDDIFPPIIHLDYWEDPIPLPGPLNTAGVEESPFITLDNKDFYFFFTPDASASNEKRMNDGVSGIWWSKLEDRNFSEPERVRLSNDAALDNVPFILGENMWFSSERKGNYGEEDIYTAELDENIWGKVKNAGEQLNKAYDVGELQLTWDGLTMYCSKKDINNSHKKDICTLSKIEAGWSQPQALPDSINTQEFDEDHPFITTDGKELWFTGQSRLGYPGPAVFRCLYQNGSFGEPVEVISNFAEDAILDSQGNLYFVHYFMSSNQEIIESDIYVAYRR